MSWVNIKVKLYSSRLFNWCCWHWTSNVVLKTYVIGIYAIHCHQKLSSQQNRGPPNPPQIPLFPFYLGLFFCGKSGMLHTGWFPPDIKNGDFWRRIDYLSYHLALTKRFTQAKVWFTYTINLFFAFPYAGNSLICRLILSWSLCKRHLRLVTSSFTTPSKNLAANYLVNP